MEDVVIIGGGPAGLACAWRLHTFGESPLVLEAAAFPRDKVCGDALSGKVVSVLRRLGGEAVVAALSREPFAVAAKALAFMSEGGEALTLRVPQLDGVAQGFVAPRAAWDAWLWRIAPASLRLKTGARVLSLTRGVDHWVLQLAGGEVILARYVVGADGVASRVRPFVYTYRRVRQKPPVYTAIRLYGAWDREPDGILRLYFERPYLPGYFWAFPTSWGWNLGIGAPPLARPLSLRGLLRRRLGLGPDTPIAGHGLPISVRNWPLTAPGCALVGDAGHLVDPFTGEGIGNALLSGYRLAEAIAQVPPERRFDWDARCAYEEPLYRTLEEELKVSRWLHKIAHWPWMVSWLLGRLAKREAARAAVEDMLFNVAARRQLRSWRFYWDLLR